MFIGCVTIYPDIKPQDEYYDEGPTELPDKEPAPENGTDSDGKDGDDKYVNVVVCTACDRAGDLVLGPGRVCCGS